MGGEEIGKQRADKESSGQRTGALLLDVLKEGIKKPTDLQKSS
jgi:hypothetical protein